MPTGHLEAVDDRDEPDRCPVCGSPYERRVTLDSRTGQSIGVSNASVLCQSAKRRESSGPTMKPTRSDTESYTFVGYIHA